MLNCDVRRAWGDQQMFKQAVLSTAIGAALIAGAAAGAFAAPVAGASVAATQGSSMRLPVEKAYYYHHRYFPYYTGGEGILLSSPVFSILLASSLLPSSPMVSQPLAVLVISRTGPDRAAAGTRPAGRAGRAHRRWAHGTPAGKGVLGLDLDIIFDLVDPGRRPGRMFGDIALIPGMDLAA